MWGLKSAREITKVMGAETYSPGGFLVRFTVSLSIDLPATATIETIEPLIVQAEQCLRKLGGKLEVAMERDGPCLVLRGPVALWQSVATLTFLVVEPFPRRLFAPPNRCG
jgi:hypothetical protein